MSTVYQASSIRRQRSTKAEVEARREALFEIIAEMRPMTVRQVFYQATVRGLVEKAESGYAKVQTDLTLMRREGILPYDWLADNTRWQRKPRTFDSVEEALNETARFYRKNLWANADSYVEIWLEKDALAGVVLPVTAMFDVPLMVTRGYASCRSCTPPPSTSTPSMFRPTSIIAATSIRAASTQAKKLKRPCASLHPTPKFSSSVSRSLLRRSMNGSYLLARQKPQILAQKVSVPSASSWTPSNQSITRAGTRRD